MQNDEQWNHLLHSSRLEEQVEGLSQAKKAISSIVDEVLDVLAVTDNKTIFADYLSRLGPVITPQLEQRFSSYPEGELKTTAALLLLHFGSKVGLSEVLAALSCDDDNRCLAASKLANAGIADAVRPIVKLLREVIASRPLDEKSVPELTTLIRSLQKLNVDIPSDIRVKLTSREVPAAISGILEGHD